MNDTPEPFASFVPSGTPPETAAPEGKKKERKKRERKAATTKADPAPTPKATRTKKQRKPRAAGIMKIGIGAAIIALAGLSADDVELLKSAAAVLIDKPKKQRQRIAAALAKIFA